MLSTLSIVPRPVRSAHDHHGNGLRLRADAGLRGVGQVLRGGARAPPPQAVGADAGHGVPGRQPDARDHGPDGVRAGVPAPLRSRSPSRSPTSRPSASGCAPTASSSAATSSTAASAPGLLHRPRRQRARASTTATCPSSDGGGADRGRRGRQAPRRRRLVDPQPRRDRLGGGRGERDLLRLRGAVGAVAGAGHRRPRAAPGRGERDVPRGGDPGGLPRARGRVPRDHRGPGAAHAPVGLLPLPAATRPTSPSGRATARARC